MAIAIPLAAICVVPAAAVIGWAAERLRGLDLAIGTFALALTFQFLVFGSLSRTLAPDTAGSASVVQVARPNFWSLELDSNRSFYLYALALGAIAYVLVAALGRSATGRELLAIGDDPTRASVTGIQVGRLRVLAFVVGGGLAALGGALLVSAREAVTPETFTAFESLSLLALAVVGGLASARGAIIGGAFGAVLPELARVDPFRFLQGRLTLVYGIALVVVLAAKRGGLVALIGLDRRAQPELAAGGSGVPDACTPASVGSRSAAHRRARRRLRRRARRRRCVAARRRGRVRRARRSERRRQVERVRRRHRAARADVRSRVPRRARHHGPSSGAASRARPRPDVPGGPRLRVALGRREPARRRAPRRAPRRTRRRR